MAKSTVPRWYGGERVEVWNMATGTWKRAIVTRVGNYWKAGNVTLSRDGEGTVWRIPQPRNYCSKCERPFYDPACGPTHAVIAAERAATQKEPA